MLNNKIYDSTDFILSHEHINDMIQDIYDTTNHIITLKNNMHKIISFSSNERIYYDRNSFYFLLQKYGVPINNTSAINLALDVLKSHSLLTSKYTKFIQFFNLQKTFNFRYTGEFFIINANEIGYNYNELELSKRDNPQLRNVSFSFL